MGRQRVMEKMVKVSTYFSQKERDIIDQHRYDTSRSLFIRQAVRRAINENENDKNAPSGQQVSHQSPQTAAPSEVCATSTPTTTEEEVIEAV